ncbi:MAG: hypothetical protein WD512_05175, partial [Candidatus Paceibacterota bacterium]
DYDMIDGIKKYCKSYTCFHSSQQMISGKKLFICDNCYRDDKNYRCEDHVKGKLYQKISSPYDSDDSIYCMDCIIKKVGVYNEKEWDRIGKEEEK